MLGKKLLRQIKISVEDKFGSYPSNQHQKNLPILAGVSLFVDICSSMILDGRISSIKTGERELVKRRVEECY
ncbi:hypothetical protein NOVO_06815 [Rickettsiales bacterium Ac37b]|nr:hypothetical protein NOVO_06815 [Rickettsiales bacterium Ac37b]